MFFKKSKKTKKEKLEAKVSFWSKFLSNHIMDCILGPVIAMSCIVATIAVVITTKSLIIQILVTLLTPCLGLIGGLGLLFVIDTLVNKLIKSYSDKLDLMKQEERKNEHEANLSVKTDNVSNTQESSVNTDVVVENIKSDNEDNLKDLDLDEIDAIFDAVEHHIFDHGDVFGDYKKNNNDRNSHEDSLSDEIN